jgi:pyruvate,water dikinase
VVPRIRQICHRIRDNDYESPSAVELAESLDALYLEAVVAFTHTMEAGRSAIDKVVEYFSFCERELPPDGLLQAGVMIQGFENESAGAGRALGELAALAARTPELAAALRSEQFGDIEAVEGGAGFVARLNAFLDEYGWRAESWSLTHAPVWAEDRTAALRQIARYLNDTQATPRAVLDLVTRQREQARQDAFARLSGENRRRLNELLSDVENVTRLTEGRAFWQLTAAGVLRAPILALGKKLVDAGVLDLPNDVFFFYIDEVKEVARTPRRMQTVVSERKREFERWERLNPPAFVGAAGPPPAPPDPSMQMAFKLVLGVGVPFSVEGSVITGMAASRGVVRGRARLIRSLSDSAGLQRGEIMVCPTTSPAWTHLFAIAGGVVTDSGGILTHSAICAREFGIPCVVGTQVATARIPDGALVTLDGSAGTVTLES